ncbi:MAG TPA: tRNA uridine-5-carboxymethylaminomethyl(34) synthesis GTPase MnmE [Dyella sp.]|nr:tRNA uridine-5-carboxymethylaminomethyl(34) synthesis GTPase MnmE [Dyella sp.]
MAGWDDTIVALATAPGVGAIAVIRLSGSQSFSIVDRLFPSKKISAQASHTLHVGFLKQKDRLIDEVVLSLYRGPHSYTGEDVIEISCHGSPYVQEQVLEACLAEGARLAKPGEFTQRAFLHGKLDLAQAEAVADLIAARSQTAARAALQSMEGVFSQRVHALLQQLIDLRVHVEAAIDFPEEEIDFLAAPAIAGKLQALRDKHATLLQEAERGVRLGEGLRVAIVGRPNAGKSSLLNALAGRDRAIVTSIAGTTRDVLRETVQLDGIALELADTAGLRDTDDEVEREGVRRAHGELATADVALLVTEQVRRTDDLTLLAHLPPGVTRVVVVNKIDRDGLRPSHEVIDGLPTLGLSARTGEGVDALRGVLKQLAGQGGGEGAFSARRRHVDALLRVGDHLQQARHALLALHAGELAAEELRQAQHALGEITGSYTSDDLLGAIFGSFCIGK